jgi:hypothetical protein|tara:strand:- start:697 stop:1215 length:519 start_codon:yes stop_codon:yes gene_type:complete
MAEKSEIKRELGYIGDRLIKYMTMIIEEQGHSASGALTRGFYFSIKEDSDLVQLSIGNSRYYWERIDNYGKQKYPTNVKKNVIYRWMELKGGFEGDLSAIASKIAKELNEEGWPTERGMAESAGRSDFSGKADMMAEQEGLYNSLDSAFNEAVNEYLSFLNEEGKIIDVVAG